MAKSDITATELVWPGKYNEDGTRREIARVNLPFQIIETVNESRATREEKKTANEDLFDYLHGEVADTFEAGWKNKLIWGDNLLVMGSLLEKFAGKINLIYIDPPFATGANFSFNAEVGETGEEVSKAQTIIEEKAYRDTWGKNYDSYIAMMYDRLVLMHELLADNGSIYVHCDWRVNSYLRLVLDDVFGASSYRNEIAWRRVLGGKSDAQQYGRSSDRILFYTKSEFFTFNPPRLSDVNDSWYNKTDKRGRYVSRPLTAAGGTDGDSGQLWRKVQPTGHWTVPGILATRYQNETGKVLQGSVRKRLDELADAGYIEFSSNGLPSWRRYLDEANPPRVADMWFDDEVKPLSRNAVERLDYPTQKPGPLLKRIITASSNKGDLVADFFCGSGTTVAVAEKLGRRWLTSDLGRWAVHTTRKRMLGIAKCKPFDVLNLGKYERQYWQGVSFGGGGKNITEQSLFQYLAFIIKLYRAQPLAGMTHLHAKKGDALVHIGAVDAPVTINQVNQAVEECVRVKQKKLHVLGWEWEMGLNKLVVGEAKTKGVKLSLFNIPREVMDQQAADKGDVRFFELAYLAAKITRQGKRAAKVALTDFVIPDADTDELQGKISQWSDYVDYWAVDWDFQGDTFMQGWVAYRTRRERKLPLVSDAHTYDAAGKYRVLVKVVDIFGNDTSQMLTVAVK